MRPAYLDPVAVVLPPEVSDVALPGVELIKLVLAVIYKHPF
jgi:hypothetical protein